MGQPVTTNPFLICMINMTVVFVVLYGLCLIVQLIKYLDPTRKKKLKTEMPEAQANAAVVELQKAQQENDDELIVIFTAALAAYGLNNAKIVSIRPVGNRSWAQAGRLEAVNARNCMFN